MTGDYPFNPNTTIRIDEASGQEFALDFRDPVDLQLKAARINGQEITLSKTDRGYYRMVRAWKTGDVIALEFEYLLKTHIVTREDDPVWVAFTYGPRALAQTTNEGGSAIQPFIGKDVGATLTSQWLEPLPSHNDAAPKFRIRNTEIRLGPFYATGSEVTGPRTYFRITPRKE